MEGEEDSGATQGEQISHNALLKKVQELKAELLDDPFLSDVAIDCSAEDVGYQLALAQGKAITVNFKKFDGEVICK